LVCKPSWLGALRRECLLPSQEVQQRHGGLQINPAGASVMLRLGVAVLDKDAAIAFTLRLDAKHHRNAESVKMMWTVYSLTEVYSEPLFFLILYFYIFISLLFKASFYAHVNQ